MAILDTLRAAQGGRALAELGKANGISPQQAGAVVAAVLPELTQAFERNTLSRGGLADLVQALGQGHHRAYLDTPALYKHPGAVADGNAILEHLVGSKDASRGIADRAAQTTGVDSAIIRGMLPVVAGMTMGGLSKEVQGAFGDILGRMGLPMPDSGGMGGGGLGIPDVSRLPGGSGGAGLPMGNHPPQERLPGNPGGTGGWGGGDVRSGSGGGLEMPDRVPQSGDPGGWDRGGRGRGSTFPFPLPQGGGDNPYGDLSDILRRGLGLPGGSGGPVIVRVPGGGQMGGGGGLPFPMPGGGGGGGGGIQLPGGAVGGGLLWNIVRSVLGGALGGFQSQGMMGWIIKAVVMRYGWSILRALLGRGFGR